MGQKLVCAKSCPVICLIILMFSGIGYAGPNSTAACRLDMNFNTAEIEPNIAASVNDIITVGSEQSRHLSGRSALRHSLP